RCSGGGSSSALRIHTNGDDGNDQGNRCCNRSDSSARAHAFTSFTRSVFYVSSKACAREDSHSLGPQKWKRRVDPHASDNRTELVTHCDPWQRDLPDADLRRGRHADAGFELIAKRDRLQARTVQRQSAERPRDSVHASTNRLTADRE